MVGQLGGHLFFVLVGLWSIRVDDVLSLTHIDFFRWSFKQLLLKPDVVWFYWSWPIEILRFGKAHTFLSQAQLIQKMNSLKQIWSPYTLRYWIDKTKRAHCLHYPDLSPWKRPIISVWNWAQIWCIQVQDHSQIIIPRQPIWSVNFSSSVIDPPWSC